MHHIITVQMMHRNFVRMCARRSEKYCATIGSTGSEVQEVSKIKP